MIHIEKAGVPDAPVISFLGKQTFRETFGYLFNENELNKYLEETFSITKLESSLAKPHNIFGILYYLDEPVGYYKVKIGSNYEGSLIGKQAQVQKIYVLKDHIGKKLGKALLENIFDLKEIEDHETLWLVILHTNYRAIQFYEDHGFQKLKKYYHTIGLHDLEYELMIKSKKEI